jgi:flavin-dependent dehydrogenase
VHPEHVDVWYWLIPFADGRCSLGVVARSEFLEQYPGDDQQRLRALIDEDPTLRRLLAEAQWDTPVRRIVGYASNVSRLCGPGYALLGNAGEFLDPVFSSGVTIAFKSASLAVAAIEREVAGIAVDWELEYAQVLRAGVDCFRGFVEAWYAGSFQKIIFHQPQPAAVRRMICSILAGYAWDLRNPYVAEPKRRLGVLEAICA